MRSIVEIAMDTINHLAEMNRPSMSAAEAKARLEKSKALLAEVQEAKQYHQLQPPQKPSPRKREIVCHHFWNMGTVAIRANDDGTLDIACSQLQDDPYSVELGEVIAMGRLDRCGPHNAHLVRRCVSENQARTFLDCLDAIQRVATPTEQKKGFLAALTDPKGVLHDLNAATLQRNGLRHSYVVNGMIRSAIR